MQSSGRRTQTSTAPTELTTRTRADAESNLNGLARSTSRYWVGSAALAAGIGAVVAPITLTSTPAGQGLTLGFGAFIAFFALLSLLARNQTPAYWGLFVSGFALSLLPWLGAGFNPDPAAAWTAWVAGFLAMALGAFGWLNSSRRLCTASTRTPAGRQHPRELLLHPGVELHDRQRPQEDFHAALDIANLVEAFDRFARRIGIVDRHGPEAAANSCVPIR